MQYRMLSDNNKTCDREDREMSNKKSAQVPETPKAENKNMSKSIIEQAKEKIKTPITGKLNQKAGAINKPTAAAMELFCEQSEEFARAIIESDKTFSDR